MPVLAGPLQAVAPGARRVVDATLGHGGHAALFLASGAEVLGVDRDPDALEIARHRLAGAAVTFLAGSFGDAAVHQAVVEFRPDFILLDLGVSSRQLDEDPRGFTFRPGAPLDMRMDRTGPTAADVLNTADEAELTAIFRDFGDERRARGLAREVARRRTRAPFAVSDDLVNAIRAVLGPQSGAADFARLFQAVRIAVNGELEVLERSLPLFRDALTPGGTLAVISYHSGEDRIVKRYFHEWARACVCPPEQPVCTCRGRPLGAAEPRRAITADAAEIEANPRSRSARLRIFRKAE
ncbi:MAG TPA: 16S rRNA (cytosine(1402)-N(4))-methyltransferase RsmH [Gemmatimonadales bacterium]|nr:16S rRNA (cytosine(1402)-N(4))-methyltransferase RsmH [Gemmatimonadales bacterium]